MIVGAFTDDYDKTDIHQYNDIRWFWIILALGTILWTLLLWYYDYKLFDNILWIPEEKFRKKKKHDNNDDIVDDDAKDIIDKSSTDDEGTEYEKVSTTVQSD